MKNKITGIFLIIILLVCGLNTRVYSKEIPDELKNLYAQSAVLMDADNGRILFGKNEKKVLPMASTTKIMTCILALENMRENQIGIVSDYAASQPKVHLGVRSGEQFYLEDLLYSLMLESHNDSAVVIAESIGGTVEEFAAMMNEKAIEIGCTDTYFITPNGLDAGDEQGIHSTTAADLALIMRYCIQVSQEKERFLEITRTSAYQFTDITGRRNFFCNNHNAFLGMMEGALSGKTGFTNGAGYCYVGALRQGDKTFVVSLLACGWPNNKGYKWKDTKKLMEYGLKNYEYQTVWEEISSKEIAVKDGIDFRQPFENDIYIKTSIQTQNQEMKLLINKEEEMEIKMIYEEPLYAPVKGGEKVGTVFYILDDMIIKTCAIVADQIIEKRTVSNCFRVIMGSLLL